MQKWDSDLIVDDLSRYNRLQPHNPDPSRRIDRWHVASDARNVDELIFHVSTLIPDIAQGDWVLFDPFAGCGSGALMARELGIKYVGAELNSFRGSSALAKGFLSVEVLLDAGREEPGLVEHVARTMMDTHKLRFGEAIELIEADLRASPPPCDGYMHLGDFRDVPRPEWISGRPCVLLLCPPFPGSPSRWPHVDGIAPDVRAEILREEVGPFEKLLSDAAAWFRDCSSGSEIRVVTAEYFDYFPEYSAGLATVTALAKLDLEMTVGILEESDRSPLGRSGFVVAGASLPDQWKSNN